MFDLTVFDFVLIISVAVFLFFSSRIVKWIKSFCLSKKFCLRFNFFKSDEDSEKKSSVRKSKK